MAYQYYGKLFHTKKEWIIDTCKNMNKSQNHYVEPKKLSKTFYLPSLTPNKAIPFRFYDLILGTRMYWRYTAIYFYALLYFCYLNFCLSFKYWSLLGYLFSLSSYLLALCALIAWCCYVISSVCKSFSHSHKFPLFLIYIQLYIGHAHKYLKLNLSKDKCLETLNIK